MVLSKSTLKKVSAIVRFLLLSLFVILFFLPLFSMLVTSLKTMAELYRIPPKVFPEKPLWENYKIAWEMVQYGRYLMNSILLSVLYTLPVIIGSCFTGYGFSRFQVKENKLIFMVMLATMMIPFMVTIMPLFLIMAKMGLINNRAFWVIWGIPGLPFIIFLFKQYFSTIPASFEESARLEGAGRFQIFFSIMFPLVQTAIIIAAIFAFQWSWSNYLMPVLFLSGDKVNLAVKLSVGYTDAKENPLHNYAMAGIVYYSLPIVILFFTLQKRFVAGLLAGGLKG